MAQHQPLFKFLFQQNYCLLTTVETVDLIRLPMAGPGELFAGWELEECQGAAVLRGRYLATLHIIVVSVSALVVSLVQPCLICSNTFHSYALYANGFLSILQSPSNSPTTEIRTIHFLVTHSPYTLQRTIQR